VHAHHTLLRELLIDFREDGNQIISDTRALSRLELGRAALQRGQAGPVPFPNECVLFQQPFGPEQRALRGALRNRKHHFVSRMQHGLHVRVSLPHFPYRRLVGGSQHAPKPILVIMCIGGNRRHFRLGFLGTRLENQGNFRRHPLHLRESTKGIKGELGGFLMKVLELAEEIMKDAWRCHADVLEGIVPTQFFPEEEPARGNHVGGEMQELARGDGARVSEILNKGTGQVF